MATWNLGPCRETAHGIFSREFAPVITIDSGDTVVYQTLEAGWGLEPRNPWDPDHVRRTFDDWDPDRRGNGHCLVGPVEIRGAKPGMTLEVRVDEIRVGDWGWTGCWTSPISEGAGVKDGEWDYLVWSLDADKNLAENRFGHQVKLRPFMGVMGMPPDEPGHHSTAPPRRTGGNLDCKELVAGTTLFLPIEVEGGLFSLGDGHAVQGDGEVSGTAIECPMERVAVTLSLHEDMPMPSPRARIPGAWITFGLNEDLDQAAFAAVSDMVTILSERFDVSRAAALALASVAVDVHVTQYVNGVKGAHAILRDDAILKC